MILFFHDTPTPEIYTLSLHDALPILARVARRAPVAAASAGVERRSVARADAAVATGRERGAAGAADDVDREQQRSDEDRKSTRLNSSHSQISYAVFCLKKKKKKKKKD